MFEHRYNTYIQLVYFITYVSLIFSFIFSLCLSYENADIRLFKNIISIPVNEFISILFIFIFVMLIHILFIIYFHSLKNKFNLPHPKYQFFNISIISFADVVVAYCAQRFLSTEVLSWKFYLYFYFLTNLLNVLALYAVYESAKFIYSTARNRRNFVMVGSSDRSIKFSKFFEQNKAFGFYNIGYLDDANYSGEKISLLGHIDDLQNILRKNIVDVIIVSLPVRSYYDSIMNIINISEVHGIPVYFMTDIFKAKHSNIVQSTVEGTSSLTLHTAPIDGWSLFCKRIFDIIFSLFSLVIFSPLLIISAFLIKMIDNGNILYTQKRVGYNKRIFQMYKFRTMCINADKMQNEFIHLNEMDGPVFKIKNDPRITPVGRFLRKYSIDELPQLFNVLLGDMSIVGPRPMALRDYEGFPEDWQRRRFSMRPGLTCYWQVRGRNALNFETWMHLDMEYIDNWSFLEDIKIIFLTIPAVLQGSGE